MVDIVSIPTIVAVVCSIMAILKKAINNELFNTLIPLISAVLGSAIGIVLFIVYPELIPADNAIMALIIGAVSGWGATGANQTVKQIVKSRKEEDQANYENLGNDA